MARFSAKKIIIAVLALAASVSAEAGLISVDINVPTNQIDITSFVTNGFLFTATSGAFSMREYTGGGSEDYFMFGSKDPLFPLTPPILTQVSIEQTNGNPFDLVRFSEIADAYGIFGGLGVQTLTSDRGGKIDLYSDISNPDHQYLDGLVDAPALFTNIKSLTFNELTPSFAAYDNFVFRVSDVPEPATIVLLTIGMVGLAFVGRRKPVTGI